MGGKTVKKIGENRGKPLRGFFGKNASSVLGWALAIGELGVSQKPGGLSTIKPADGFSTGFQGFHRVPRVFYFRKRVGRRENRRRASGRRASSAPGGLPGGQGRCARETGWLRLRWRLLGEAGRRFSKKRRMVAMAASLGRPRHGPQPAKSRCVCLQKSRKSTTLRPNSRGLPGRPRDSHWSTLSSRAERA